MRRRLIAAAAAALCVGPAALLAHAAPTCTTLPTSVCGGRVVAPPLQTATFLQFGSEFVPALKAIEAEAPGFVEVHSLAEWLGDPAAKSAGGRPLMVVRVTNEAVKGPKRKVVSSLSVHGNEPAGREGGTRYLEDLAQWAVHDPSHKLYSGDASRTVKDVLDHTELYLAYLNPDGWAAGDFGNPQVIYKRTNDNGTDGNREFPTIGWTNRPATPLSDPESKAWVRFLNKLGKLTTASDIHGELESENSAFTDLLYPADEWTPLRQKQELQLGTHMIETINRKWSEEGVLLQKPAELTGFMTPSNAAASYDVVGYDDGGFMGDYFAQGHDAVEIDAENFLSHTVPSNVWIGPLEEAHVAGVKGIIESLLVESMITNDVKVQLHLGKVAYAFDPQHVTSKDGLGYQLNPGEKQVPYDVTRMKYFDSLRAFAGPRAVIDPLASADIASGAAKLSKYDTLVLDDIALPRDTKGRPVSSAKYAAAIVSFVRSGGQLLLTDAATRYLSHFGFTLADLRLAKTDGGHIDFGAHSHPWEKELQSTASQTYYEVPLGFPPNDAAPNYGVSTAAWSARGGTTVGTVTGSGGGQAGNGSFTALGELPFGKGKVSIFGSILPTPTEAYPHVQGLANYGVTISGGQVLNAILGYKR